jgi:phage-related protein
VQLWRDSFLFVFGQETINNVMQIGENLKLIMGRSILAIVDLWKFQINLIVQAWQGLVNFILPILNQIVSAWNTTVNYISSTWTQAWNLVTLGFQTAMNNIVTTTTNGVNRVIGAWNSFINPIQKSIYDAFVYASGVVINWGNTIVNALNNLTARFTSWVSNLAVSAYNWGANFISNFAKGIQDNIAQATGAVANMTRAVADFLPHSPSEKGAFRTLGETGFAFTDTFISGIKKSGIDGFFNNLFSAPENNLGLSNPPRNQETQQGLQLIYAPVITGSKNDADYILAQLKSRERDLLDLLDKANRRTGRGNY